MFQHQMRPATQGTAASINNQSSVQSSMHDKMSIAIKLTANQQQCSLFFVLKAKCGTRNYVALNGTMSNQTTQIDRGVSKTLQSNC